MLKRRTAVFVVPCETVGHDLKFRHYTNKVVVGKYPKLKMDRAIAQAKDQRLKKDAR
jgi:hypothetical protein